MVYVNKKPAVIFYPHKLRGAGRISRLLTGETATLHGRHRRPLWCPDLSCGKISYSTDPVELALKTTAASLHDGFSY